MSKVYSLDKVNELAGGDQEFIVILVQTFLEEIPPDVDSMLQAVQENNPKMAYQYAHKMKPNLQLFDIDLLAEIKSIEAWSKTNDGPEPVMKTINYIVSTVTAAIGELKEDFA